MLPRIVEALFPKKREPPRNKRKAGAKVIAPRAPLAHPDDLRHMTDEEVLNLARETGLIK